MCLFELRTAPLARTIEYEKQIPAISNVQDGDLDKKILEKTWMRTELATPTKAKTDKPPSM